MSTTTRESADHLIEHVSQEIEFLQRLMQDLARLKEDRRWGHPYAANQTVSQKVRGGPSRTGQCEVRAGDGIGLLAEAEREIDREAMERDIEWKRLRLKEIEGLLGRPQSANYLTGLIIERERLERELKGMEGGL
jgi:hypothetical protein